MTKTNPPAPRPLKDVLGSPGIEDLRRHARRLLRLEKAIHGKLPPPLPDHCRVANLHRDELVLQADSPAWASRLRYLAPMLVERLRQDHGLTVTAITVRTRLHNTPPDGSRPGALRRKMPARTSALLNALGEQRDDALGRALQRLARHGRG